MRLLAPAKINLHLRVGPPRADGFHPLLSWMCTIGLFDTLVLDPSDVAQVSLTCDRPWVPCDQTNLVHRAAALLREHAAAQGRNVGLRVGLEKRIPVGAGLGGGSSDAARMLLGLNQFWGLGLSGDQLAPMAAALGSDVPFFLNGQSALCSGRGEVVQPVAAPKPHWAVLLLPPFGVSTPQAYQRFDQLCPSGCALDRPDIEQWVHLSADSLLDVLVNDLEAAAFSLVPELARLRDSAQGALSRIVRMSGSGSSLFTLFDSDIAAHEAAHIVMSELKIRAVAVRLAPTFEDDLTQRPAPAPVLL